jgi:16S rRNA (uracil1498-N3)-methyltransferase
VPFAAASGAAAHVFASALPDQLAITGSDAHHLARVRRLQRSERVTVADGRGAWRAYDVTATDTNRLELAATGPVEHEPPLRPSLVVGFAITKGSKPEAAVRQLTELGVDRIRPSFSARSVPRWDERRAAQAAERLRRVAREAAAQCRRSVVPGVDDLAPLEHLRGAPGLLVADREGAPEPPPGDWTLVVGPEGGLTAAELAALGDPPRLAVGRHVLRADTAVIAAAALLAARRVPADGHPA